MTTEAGRGHGADMRVLPSEVVIEPVDRDGNPVGLGVLADRMYVTKLTGGVMPLIRYEVRDQVMLVDSGEATPRIVVHGRTEQEWRWSGGAQAYVNSIWDICARHGADQLLATRLPDGVQVAIVATADSTLDAATLRDELGAELEAVGLKAPVVEIELRESLPRMDKPVQARWHDPEPLPASDVAAE